LWYADTIHPDLADRAHINERFRRQGSGYSWDLAPSARLAHYRRLAHSAFPFHVEMLNKAAHGFSLEYRHPFFDKRLVEFCLALPADQKLRLGTTRYVMRQGLAHLLPAEVYERPGKARVAHRYVSALLRASPPSLGERILEDVPELGAYVNMKAIRSDYHRYLTLEEGNALNVWHVATLAGWLRAESAAQEHWDRAIATSS
jgi:asparagine synthase (glutamine-hydrolysing)